MIDKSENVADLLAALSKFQASVTGARKGGTNPHFRSNYTRLEDAWAAAREHLGANGLSVYQAPLGRSGAMHEGYVGVTTLLGHESGQWMQSTIVVGLDERQSGSQAYGSATTYACRYAFLAALGLAPTDDDGNAASVHGQHVPPTQTPANTNGTAPNVQEVDERVATTEKINRMAAEAARAMTPPKTAPAGTSHEPSKYGDNTPETPIWFGKHKGTPICELPDDYLEWLRDKGQKEDLRNLAAAVLAAKAIGSDEPPPPTDDDDPGEPLDEQDLPF